MSVSIVPYNFTGDSRLVDKSSSLTSLLANSPFTEITGVFRAPTSLLYPTFRIDLTPYVKDYPTVYEAIIQSLNYILIYDFKRYYHVTEMIFVNEVLIDITCTVDTLHTYRNPIKTLSCMVLRNQYTYNSYIVDDERSYYINKSVVETVPTNVSDISDENPIVQFSWDLDSGVHNFVVVSFQYNHANSQHIITNKQPTNIAQTLNLGLPSVNDENFNLVDWREVHALDALALAGLALRAIEHSDTIGSYIGSIVAFPFDSASDVHTEDYLIVRFGNTYLNFADGQVKFPRGGLNTTGYMPIAVFDMAGASSYIDYPPYTVIEIYLPFIGYVEVNPVDVYNKRIWVLYIANYEDGRGLAMIYTSSKTYTFFDPTWCKLIYSGNCQIGRKISVSSSNMETNEINKINQNISTVLSVGLGILSTVYGAATSNPLAIMGGVGAITGGVAKQVQSDIARHDKANVSLSGDIACAFSPLKVRYRITKASPTTTSNNTYNSIKGLPLYETRLLSTLSGLTICDKPRLDSLSCTEEEKANISSLLQSGIIL